MVAAFASFAFFPLARWSPLLVVVLDFSFFGTDMGASTAAEENVVGTSATSNENGRAVRRPWLRLVLEKRQRH